MNALIQGAVNGAASTRAPVFVDSSGRIVTASPQPLTSLPKTYAIGFQMTPAAAATDIFAMLWAVGVVRLLNVTVSAVATAAATFDLALIRRQTLNSGGTFTDLGTINGHDSLEVAANTDLIRYTVNPAALGTTGATLGFARLGVAVAGTPTFAPTPVVWDYRVQGCKPPVIRFATDEIVLNWQGQASPAGLLLDVNVMWSEE